MAVNSINTSTSLFRPIPASRLQQNLAEHFQRTSDFVSENFNTLRQDAAERSDTNDLSSEPPRSASMRERVRPAGLGGIIDMFV